MVRNDLRHTSKSFIMKVEFLKDHVISRAGSTEIVSKERANYLIRTGVAKKHVAHKEEEVAPKVKEEKPVEKKTKEDKAPKDITTKSIKHK